MIRPIPYPTLPPDFPEPLRNFIMLVVDRFNDGYRTRDSLKRKIVSEGMPLGFTREQVSDVLDVAIGVIPLPWADLN